jgi:DNA-binding transcriptional LysR family regulator
MRHLRLYRAIRAIQKSGSIRKAAESLSVSPSALNRALQGFEEEFGYPVFDRLAGGVRLSVAGELLIQVIDRHLAAMNALQSTLSELQSGLRGTLRLSVASDLTMGLLPQVVDAYARRFPQVSVEAMQEDGLTALTTRAADLAVTTQRHTEDTVETLASARVPVIAWGADGSAAEGAPGSLPDVLSRRVIAPPIGSGTRSQLDHLLRRHHLETPVMTSLTLAAGGGFGGKAGDDPCAAPVWILPAICEPPSAPEAPLARLPFDLGSVQVSVLRRAGEPMMRSSEAFVTMLEAGLDAAAA